MGVRVAVVGDFDPGSRSHVATNRAIELSAAKLSSDVQYAWIPTPGLDYEAVRVLEGFDGIWAAPGSPYASMAGALAAIRFARERGKPFVAT